VPPTPTSFLQQIIVETPRPNAVVSSPFDVEGSTTRYPTGGILHYRVLDSASNELGTGTITVTGQTGQPTTFSASLTFTEPEGGGAITLEISDRDQATGGYIASARVSLTTE
jgi:hypothetical protein